MATLESLELTISANAQEATRGLGKLISSLSTLSAKLTAPLNQMKEFNAELAKFKGMTGIDLGKMFKGTDKATKAAEAMKDAAATWGNRGAKAPQWAIEAQQKTEAWHKANPEDPTKTFWENHPQSSLNATGQAVLKAAQSGAIGKGAFGVWDKTSSAMADVKSEANAVTGAVQESTGALQNMGEEGEESSGRVRDALSSLMQGFGRLTSGISRFVSRIGRIASTMMIRKAIRGLINGIKEGVANAQAWSKAMNGAFSKTMESASANVQLLKNSLGATLIPVLQAIAPILNQISSALVTAINYLNQFFALLTGQSSWTHATGATTKSVSNALAGSTKAIDDSAEAASNAAKSNKELLASFDQLNVISSDGGGGGGNNDTGTDYTGMFEQLTTFEQGVKDFVGWIQENLESIKGIVEAIGLAFLAWKVGTAFEGLIGVISGWIATGATIAFTAQFSWLFTNQYLDTGKPGWLIADMLTTALGSTIAWQIADKLIGGQAGVWAASITLTFSAIAGIAAVLGDADVSAFSTESITALLVNALKAGAAVGIILGTVGGASVLTAVAGGAAAALAVFGVSIGLKAALDQNVELFSVENIASTVGAAIAAGFATVLFTGSLPAAGIVAILTASALVGIKLFTREKNILWGDVTLTKKQIEDYVSSQMFTVNPSVTIKLIGDNVTLSVNQRQQIEETLTALVGEMNIIKLGIADYSNLQTDVETLVTQVEGYIKTAKESGKLTLQLTPTLVGETEGEQADWFTNYTTGWDTVDKWFIDKGKELGSYLVKNEKGEIVASKPEIVEALMTQLAEVTDAIAKAGIGAAAEANLKLGLGDLSKKTGEQVLELFTQYKADLTSAYTDLVNEQYQKQGELVAALAIIDPNSEEYKNALAAYEDMGKNLAKAVEDGVESVSEPGKNVILEWLFGNHNAGSVDSTWTKEYLEQYIKDLGVADAIKELLLEGGFTQAELDIMDVIGFTGWDFLSKDLKKKLVETLGGITDPDTIKQLKEQLKLTASDIITVSGFETLSAEERKKFVTSLFNAYGSEDAISALKKAIPNISVGTIISMTDWPTFSSDQQLAFVNALKDAFGADAAKEAAKAAGIDIGALVAAGLDSQDPKIKAVAEGWSTIIKGEIDGTTGTVTVDTKYGKDSGPDRIKARIEAINAMVNVGMDFKEDPQNFVSNTLARVTGTVSLFASLMTDIPGLINGSVSEYNNGKKTAAEVEVKLEKESKPDKVLAEFKKAISLKLTVADKMKSSLWSIIQKYMTAHRILLAFGWAGLGSKKGLGDGGSDELNVEAKITNVNQIAKTIADAIGKEVSSKLNSLAAPASFANRFGQKNAEETKYKMNNMGVPDTFKYNFGRKLVEEVKYYMNRTSFTMSTTDGVLSLTARAMGGLVRSGDLFVANENGTSELIGRFGNQAAVANTDQMVEAMARGVAYANSEQNTLLREQNRLLMGILQKDNSVRFGASAALGRIARQSLDLYEATTGG